ncbi:MAG: hypothetical protein ACRDL3_14790 [Solirubrobacterales bacterium]
MATLALFLALGGGAAWALSKNSVGSKEIAPNAANAKDVAENSLNVGSGTVFGRTNDLPNNSSTRYAAPSGTSDAQANEGSVVQGIGLEQFETGDFYVETGFALPRGSLTFTLRANGSDTPVSCTIGTNQEACASEATTLIPETSSLSLKIVTSGSPGANAVLWGYKTIED